MPDTKEMKEGTAKLIVASSKKNSNMFYATKFFTPDPFIWLKTKDGTKVYVNSLEFGRAQKEAIVDEVVDDFEFNSGNSFPDKLVDILQNNGIEKVLVPKNFEIQYAKALFDNGIKIDIKPGIFFEERAIKTQKEVREIRKVQKVAEKAMSKAINLIQKSERGGLDKLFYLGEPLTSEMVREAIHIEFLKRGCGFEPSIVACGKDSADPHQTGEGPLFADQPIVIDIFPRSHKSGYFADMTRTVVKGEASPEIEKMYAAVLEAQEAAIKAIKPGISASAIDLMIRDHFKKCGFKTEKVDGKHQGFIHATGHGVGLEMHEDPIIYRTNEKTLEHGNVFTVEPGLYYPEIGGIRIEDLVVVTKNGVKNLTQFSKDNLII